KPPAKVVWHIPPTSSLPRKGFAGQWVIRQCQQPVGGSSQQPGDCAAGGRNRLEYVLFEQQLRCRRRQTPQAFR
ncbi:hypothetical protein ACRVA2_33030, partial [Pseudomonas aeruginosa]|uniref:hypothetical protein n=1 Tax=Pseudomonas aeruginosa TaxID=287 RepID=UPI003D7FC8FB